MITFVLDDKQEEKMNKWIAIHDKDKHCPACKRRKKLEKLRAKGKANPYGPCGGWSQYVIEITLTAVGNLAAVKCSDCGASCYLDEV